MELKHHRIKFKGAPKAGNSNEWESQINKIKGVKHVTIDMEKGELFAEYDLIECREEAIEIGMLEAGFILDDSFMEKLKRGWVHFTEENEQSEFKHKAPACCDLKDIEEKRKLKE